MSKENRTAAENADQDKPFGGDAIPRNGAADISKAQEEIYGVLHGIRDDFRSVAELYRSVQELDKHLMSVIKYSLPREWNKVGVKEGMCDQTATDEGFAAALGAMTEKRNNVARMNALVNIEDALTRTHEGLVRKYLKLDESVKLRKQFSPEWEIAVRKRTGCKESIAVIALRRKMVAELFFKTRKQVAADILKQSRAMAGMFLGADNRYPVEFVDAMNASPASELFDEIAETDRAVAEGKSIAGYKRRGWKV